MQLNVAELKEQLCKFIENSPQKTVMDDWKAEKCIALQHVADACRRNAQIKIGEMQKKQEVYILKEKYQGPMKIQERAKKLGWEFYS